MCIGRTEGAAFEFEWLCIKEIRFAAPCIGKKVLRWQNADLYELLWRERAQRE